MVDIKLKKCNNLQAMDPDPNNSSQENQPEAPISNPSTPSEIPVIQIPQPLSNELPTPSSSNTFFQNFFKSKVLIIAGAILVLLIFSTIGIFTYLKINANTIAYKNSQNSYSTDLTPFPISTFVPYTPTPEKVCNSPLAPAGAGPVSKCNYRDSKLSIPDSQAVYNRIYKVFGVTQIPSTLNFHQTTYKGVTIKWTDNQPISDTAMGWIKSAIDIMPNYYYVDHPALAIYSATPEDLQVKGVAPEYLGAIAYASGLNIFIVKDFAAGTSTQYVVNQAIASHALFHEWTHIIQFYDTLQTFTEEYLSIPGNASVVMGIDPLTKDYAKTAGWVFQDDQYGDSEYAILGTDANSQKQSDYGKTKYIEDMAEAGADFMSCHNSEISEARIAWWEKTTGTSRNTYCPAKF